MRKPECMLNLAQASLHVCTCVQVSFAAAGDGGAMLEVQLELSGTDVVYVPEIAELAAGGGGSVSGLAQGWIQAFFEAGTLIKRLDTGEGAGRVRGGSSLGARSHVCCQEVPLCPTCLLVLRLSMECSSV